MANIPTVDTVADYNISDSEVVVSLTVGDGASPATTTRFKGEITVDAVFPINLGSGADVENHIFQMVTLTTNLISATRFITVTYRIEGGDEPLSIVKKKLVNNVNDSVFFRATFTFV